MDDILELTAFAKLNLATCAAKRAKSHWTDDRRFSDEYATAMLWKGHRVVQTVHNGRPMGWVSAA